MEVEKRGLKGGFLQLFDWNGKSRKKLFSNKSELSERSSLQKENLRSSVASQCQGLQKGDGEYGAKAPGVVARLMGLDALPKPNVNGPCLTPFMEPQSCADSCYLMDDSESQMDHDIVIFERVSGKLDGLNRNPLDLKLQMAHGRPIGRFQTEVLPPKSARPISITHHPLLSPIKSPGFVPTKNAAYIIEGAAKIIEQSPRSTCKSNFQALGPCSVPLRICDLREKMDAAKRSSRLAALGKGKEQSSMKNRNSGRARSENSYLRKSSEVSKTMASRRLKSKEKSICPTAQAMDNTRKREGLASVGNRSSEKYKEHKDVKPVCVDRNLMNFQKKVEKQNLSRKPSEILRLNNKKQNCALREDAENFEPSYLHSKESKEFNPFNNYVQGEMNKTVKRISADNMVTSRKTNFVAADPGKELSASRAKTMSKKKSLTNGNAQSGGSVAQKAMVMSGAKTAKCNRKAKWEEMDKKRSLDVVSFTFASPIKKSGSTSGGKILEATTCSSFQKYDPCPNELDTSSAMSTSGFNPIAGDFLSVLLEQKLKELTSRIELSQKDASEADFSSSVNSYGNMDSSTTVTKPLTIDGKCETGKEIQNACYCPSVDELWHNADNKNKGSVLASGQQLFSGASSGSLDLDWGSSSEGTSRSFTRKYFPVAEGDLDISDSAGTSSETAASTVPTTNSKHHSFWELEYISDILSSAQLLLEEFALGQAHEIITPGLFDYLEIESYTSTEDQCFNERKVLFDCVCECLEIRCRQVVSGSCKLRHMHMTMLSCRTEWLAGNLYREISKWMNGQELTMDEVVEKDMSRKDGKWMDFEVEAFEEGVEIEKGILASLVDELIDDFLFC